MSIISQWPHPVCDKPDDYLKLSSLLANQSGPLLIPTSWPGGLSASHNYLSSCADAAQIERPARQDNSLTLQFHIPLCSERDKMRWLTIYLSRSGLFIWPSGHTVGANGQNCQPENPWCYCSWNVRVLWLTGRHGDCRARSWPIEVEVTLWDNCDARRCYECHFQPWIWCTLTLSETQTHAAVITYWWENIHHLDRLPEAAAVSRGHFHGSLLPSCDQKKAAEQEWGPFSHSQLFRYKELGLLI